MSGFGAPTRQPGLPTLVRGLKRRSRTSVAPRRPLKRGPKSALQAAVGRALVALVAMTLLAPPAVAQDEGSHIVLNGTSARVRWSDGDSFRILDGEFADTGVRLGGYNTLESYGPVHRWGEWTPAELYALARQAGDFASAGTWTCTTDGQRDHYGRLLVLCPGLTLAMVAAGFGHLFALDQPPAGDALAAQAGAQATHLGIWAKGVPTAIVTSLHSAAEGGDSIYNRVVSTTDGSSTQVIHAETYETCQEVCVEEAGSCLVYVPFDLRYGEARPPCLVVP